MEPRPGGFRGPSPYAGTGFGTGGNTVMTSATGTLPGTTDNKWHPTIVYLFGLLVIEWAAFIILTKYI